MTSQWGAPLTGAQMKLLRAAGLPDDCEAKLFGHRASEDLYSTVGRLAYYFDMDTEKFSVPADHAAYTLLEAGWLDGRNVALWFGGESWPNSWLAGSDIIRRDGTVEEGDHLECWRHNGDERDIIAYIRKAEGLTTHADAERAAKRMGGEIGQNELWGAYARCSETVTIAKMTEAEARDRIKHAADWSTFPVKVSIALETLKIMGLIREPTRLERFWATRDTRDVYGPPCKAFQLIEEALNFERD